ncbi:MAG TPA: hemolysin III family protein [Acidiferrobacter sp.]|nr:hemolysin III family protein [Acidiferrobacter sp.]
MVQLSGARRKPDRMVLRDRPQSRREEIANSALHALAVVLTLGGGLVLVHEAWRGHDVLTLASTFVFAATMVALYMASTVYHALGRGTTKDRLQRIDRAAITFLIAGTYTPIALLMIRGWIGASLCLCEWLLVLLSMAIMVRDPQNYPERSTWIYHAMGWLTALGAIPLIQHTPTPVIVALGIGGICYIMGVLFLIRDRVKYFHAVFHVFVMLGTAFQFWAISRYVG